MTNPFLPSKDAPPPAPDLSKREPTIAEMNQASYSGTPSMSGMTRPDEYVAALQDPLARMMAFEQMRKSDPSINTALTAREQMVKSANWIISPASDTPEERQIAEFCEDNLFPFLGMVLGWLGGGGLQYGFGLIEPVYGWSDRPARSGWSRQGTRMATRSYGRKIFLEKIAHIRQRTIYTFQITPTGDVEYVQQYVWDGFSFKYTKLPPWKLIQLTYNRQGDDYWGEPPMRNLYKPYTFKTQIERLNVVNMDRFGVGLPVAEAGPNWTDADYTRLSSFLQGWRSGTNNYLIYPNGGKVSVVTGDGEVTVTALQFLQYYDLAIAKTFLTQGTELGSTETGARALGETMMEQSEGIVQADCEDIADLLNERLIVPLVTMNFGVRDAYPQFVASQRVRSSSSIASVIQNLITGKAVTWQPEDEQWLRDLLGMPNIEISVIEAQKEQDAAAAKAKADAMAAQMNGQNGTGPIPPKGNATGDGNPDGGTTPPDEQDPANLTGHARTRRLVHLAAGGMSSDVVTTPPAPATWQDPHRTPELSMWEAAVLRPRVLTKILDAATDRVAGEATDAVVAINDALIAALKTAALGGVDALATAVSKVACPAGARTQLRATLTAAAQRARVYGMQTVDDERIRQQSINDPALITPANRDAPFSPIDPYETITDSPSTSSYAGRRPRYALADDRLTDPLAKMRAWFASSGDPTRFDNRTAALNAETEKAVENEVARRETAARTAAALALNLAAHAEPEVLQRAVEDSARAGLEELSPYRTRDNVSGVVNAGFGAGRNDGTHRAIAQYPDDVISKIYSAVMDFGTCDECEKWDGGEFPPDYPEDGRGVQAPNPRCYGGLPRCRCVWVLRYADETDTNVPSSKGPIV